MIGRLLVVFALGAAQVSCTQGPSTLTPSVGASVLDSTAPTEHDNQFLTAQLDRLGDPTNGVLLLALATADGSISHGTVGDASSDRVGPDDVFRIASVTKAFTAALVLTLVDEGRVNLDSPASTYVSRLPLPEEVTVRHLMAQRSGIPDYTSRAIRGDGEEGPAKAWSPEELYAFVADESLLFEPGTEFTYGNTNFLILGVLAEETTGLPFHAALRERILDPLDLDATYLSYHEEGAPPRAAFTRQVASSLVSVDFDYTSIATTVWAAGALVSNVSDLHTFFSALSAGDFISTSLVSEMTTGMGIEEGTDPARRHDYGLGVELFEAPGVVYGARGNLPGYITFVMHSPETLETLVYSSTNDAFEFEGLLTDAAVWLSD